MSQTRIYLQTSLPVVGGRVALSRSMPCPQKNPGNPIFLLCVSAVPVLTRILRCWLSASFGVSGIPSSSSPSCPKVGIPLCSGTCALGGVWCRVTPGLLSPAVPQVEHLREQPHSCGNSPIPAGLLREQPHSCGIAAGFLQLLPAAAGRSAGLAAPQLPERTRSRAGRCEGCQE